MPVEDLQAVSLPDYLRFNVRVLEVDGECCGEGRDLEALQNVLEAQIQVLRESLVIKDKEISRLTQRGPATETQPVGSAEGRGNEPTRNADPQGVLRRGGARVPEAAGLELITPLAEPDSPATPPQPVFRWVQAKWTILLVVVALFIWKIWPWMGMPVLLPG